ncbi:hypothetical protein Tco_1414570, partial [Tanacetum coccineum]
MPSNTTDYIYPIIVLSDVDVGDAFSSTTTPNYTPASSDYSLASPGNTSLNHSDDLSKYLLASLAISPFHDDPYIKDFYFRDTHRGYPDSPLIGYEESSGQDPMAPKRTSTSAAPAMTQAAIKKLVADSVSAALEAQAATMVNTDNTNMNTGEREAPV